MTTSSENVRELLEELRKAANEKEAWYGERALRELGRLVGRRWMLEYAVEQFRGFLPEVEKYHPDLHWVHTWLDMVQQLNPSIFYSLKTQLAEEPSQDYPESALSAITQYFQTALGELDCEFQDYFSGDRQGDSFGGIATCLAWLFRSQTAIYQHLHCPGAYTGYMQILNRERKEDFSQLSREELERFTAIQEASRNCAKEAPYTFWLDLANDIEKHLQTQSV